MSLTRIWKHNDIHEIHIHCTSLFFLLSLVELRAEFIVCFYLFHFSYWVSHQTVVIEVFKLFNFKFSCIFFSSNFFVDVLFFCNFRLQEPKAKQNEPRHERALNPCFIVFVNPLDDIKRCVLKCDSVLPIVCAIDNDTGHTVILKYT